MEMNLFEKVCYKFELATGTKIDPSKLTIGSESSWSTHKALSSLEYEPTGSLAVLLMTKAWQEYKDEKYVSVKDILSNDFNQRFSYMKEFEELITNGEPAQLLQQTINLIKKVATLFELKSIDSLLENKTKFIDLFEEAYSNIYDKYTIDKFGCVDEKDNEPYIAKHEYHFHTLEDFVNCLRRSDNCIVYAKIDSLYDYDDPTDYDIFYAFGCRCGDKVYINSDRDDHATPVSRAIKLNRNPQKKLRNKAESTYMPYYNIRENQGKNDQTNELNLVAIDPSINPPKAINELYDDLAQLMIVCSMSAIYQKYFIDKTIDYRFSHYGREKGKIPVEDSYFGSEIKLLPLTTTALALPNELQLPAVTLNEISVSHNGLWCNGINFYDWYIKEYINENDLKEPIPIKEFIGDKRHAELRVWWTYRNEAKTLINERRTKDVCSQFYDAKVYQKENRLVPYKVKLVDEIKSFGETYKPDWATINENKTHWLEGMNSYSLNPFMLIDFDIPSLINKNLKNILIDVFTSGEDQGRSRWSFSNFHYYLNNNECVEKDPITSVSIYPSIYENIDNPNFRADTLTRILTTESESKDAWKSYNKYHRYNKTKLYNSEIECYLDYDKLGDTICIYSGRDSISKNYHFVYKCNTFYDLCYLMNCKRDDLPKCLRRWLGTRHSFKPDTGNHILNVTDPLDRVFDIIDSKFSLTLNFYFSKSDMNYYIKKLGIDKLCIRDRSKDKEDD